MVAATQELANGLPKLVIKETQKASSTNEFTATNSYIQAQITWNGYGVAINSQNKIGVFGQDGNVDKNALAKGNLDVKIDWQAILQSKGKAWLGNGSPAALKIANTLQYADLPTRKLQAIAEAYWKKDKYAQPTIHMGNSNIPHEFSVEYRNASLSSVLNGKYIIVEDTNGNHVAFLTQDSAGRPLPPRNWERYDISIYDREYPEELDQYINTIKRKPGTYLGINDKYVTRVKPDGLEILDGNNPDSPLFSDGTLKISSNFTIDPTNPNIVYFCTATEPTDIIKLDLSADPKTWHTEAAHLPKKYKDILNLQLDPSGNLILFTSENKLVVLDRDTQTELYVDKSDGYHPYFDSSGNLKMIDDSGNVITYSGNFNEVSSAVQVRRIETLAKKVQVKQVFVEEAVRRVVPQDMVHLNPQRDKISTAFEPNLLGIRTMDDTTKAIEEIKRIKNELTLAGLHPKEVEYITAAIDIKLDEKVRVVANSEAAAILARVRAKLLKSLSLAIATEVSAEISDLGRYTVYLSHDTLEEIRKAGSEYRDRSVELFRTETVNIKGQANAIIAGIKGKINAFGSLEQYMDWADTELPIYVEQLETLAKLCPPEIVEAHQAIMEARANLQAFAREQEARFKLDNAKVREAVADRTEVQTQLIRQDTQGLIERLKMKKFKSRQAAEAYLEKSKPMQLILKQIRDLGGQNAEAARELEKSLKVATANALGEIERGSLETVTKTGQRMYNFGKTAFPIWEAKVKEHGKKSADLIFIPDDRSRGPGVKPNDMLGDVGLVIKTSTGRTEKVRLYQGLELEDNLRFGFATSKGVQMPPSYVNGQEFREIQKHYSDWSLGKESPLRKEFGKRRESVMKHLEIKPSMKKEVEYKQWKQRYDELMKEYGEFSAKNHIPILRRITTVMESPETEYANGKGYVPEWLPHWTMDRHTEKYLEDMAKALNMQLELQEGILDLVGHAGVGKDVAVKMFCSQTNRPYFGMDCTKWTTEWELSEDIILESKEGASQTVKVPSTVLNAINTPGAVLYFNEISAMTEQAQIFLHALMDEKRTITLKTSSGKVVKADPSVLLIDSRNPEYPGTFEPQFATKSRMVTLWMDYPPLKDNGNYDASEALRIARGVDSLTA